MGAGLDFYPFGLQQKGEGVFGPVAAESSNRAKFNGIEHIEETGLDMAPFRSYDAAIGRWTQVDPLAETFTNLTPYRFGFNNPISFSDPSGLLEQSGGDDPDKREVQRDKDGKPTGVRLGYSNSNTGGRAGKNNGGLGTFASVTGMRGGETSKVNNFLPTITLPTATVSAKAPDNLWKVGDDYITEHDIFAFGRADAGLGARILQEEFGTATAIKFLQFDIISAQFEFANDYSNPALLTLAPIPAIGSSRLLSAVKTPAFKRINGGFLINKRYRFQIHSHPLSPIKGRRMANGLKYPGAIRASHMNLTGPNSNLHVIFNPTKWNALSTWKGTPFRF